MQTLLLTATTLITLMHALSQYSGYTDLFICAGLQLARIIHRQSVELAGLTYTTAAISGLVPCSCPWEVSHI